MTLRDRCEALVREWRADIESAGPLNKKDLSPQRFATALQAALDATEGEALDAAIDQAMKESKS